MRDDRAARLKALFSRALRTLPDELRKEALTHVSYANEHPGTPSNERLEFLGDAVISLAAACHLFRGYPSATEGELTRMRARLVSGSHLAEVAMRAGLGEFLRLGRGEEATGGRHKAKNLAGALEALVGAYFLTCGWSRAKKMVEEAVFASPPDGEPHPKTVLQELVQRKPGATLEYRVLSVEGPDHMPVFTIGAFVDGCEVSRGTGGSKKEAEEDAARKALAAYGWNGPTGSS